MPATDTATTAQSPDPITVEVIGHALASIVEEMGEALVRASYSTNIKERRDSSTCLFDARGRTLCQASHIPMHLGSLIGIIEEIHRRVRPEDIREGDVFMGNDAYTGGGTHLPDIVLAEPVFLDGRLVAWATNTAHHADFVDRSHAHIFQEGLRIPPVRLNHAGEVNSDILDLVLLNCQVPRERLNDLRAQMAANRLGIERFKVLCRRHGRDVLLAACEALLDYAERLTRSGIRSIPSGTYTFEDVYESNELDGTLKLSVRVEVRDDEIHFDFAAPPQVRAGVNLVETALLAAVYYAVKALVGPDIPPNAGLFRPIHVRAPKGSILNAAEPAAVNSRLHTGQRVVDLIFGALAPALPDRIVAACNGACVNSTFSGVDPRRGQFYVYLETIGGGFGARATKDGLDGVHVHLTNTSNLPVEALETEYPLVLERYELVQDSGGAGEHRGGMGLMRQVRIEGHECRTYIHGSRFVQGPWGLFGGHAGGCARFDFSNGVEFPMQARAVIRDGQRVRITTPGSGGYGEPRRRAREAVARDLAEGRISRQVARDVYRLEE
jgi:N-methylhydantoinase B